MAAQDREQATGLLNSLTLWIGALAAAMVGVFAGIAAATVPGTSSAAAGVQASSNDEGTVTDAGQAAAPTPAPLQAPVSAPVAAPQAVPQARSGGSSHR